MCLLLWDGERLAGSSRERTRTGARGKVTYNIPYCIELLSLTLGPDQSGGNLPTAYDLNISLKQKPSFYDKSFDKEDGFSLRKATSRKTSDRTQLNPQSN